MTQKKVAKLFDDEFNPGEETISFWRIPKGVMMLPKLSWGAKALYGVLYGMAHKHGTAYPTHERIKKWLGNPSDSTIYRWQQELVKYRLIRVLQKGKHMSNNYYFLRHPLIENMTKSEFFDNQRVVYRGPHEGTPKLIPLSLAAEYYSLELLEWYKKSQRPGQYPMPKAYFPQTAEERKQDRNNYYWALVDKCLFLSGEATTIELEAASNY